MTQRGLFDVRPVALARSEPIATEPSPQDSILNLHPALAPDVLRVIAPSSGKPSTALVGEGGQQVTKEFWLVQLKDGRYMRRFLDGPQGPALPSVTDEYVSTLIEGGGWREITE